MALSLWHEKNLPRATLSQLSETYILHHFLLMNYDSQQASIISTLPFPRNGAGSWGTEDIEVQDL